MLDSKLPRIALELPLKVNLALRAGAEAIAQDAQSRAPVESGDLRSAIHVEDAGSSEYRIVAGNDDVFYGHFVEFGTTNNPAKPFLIPAAEAKKDAIAVAVGAALRKL